MYIEPKILDPLTTEQVTELIRCFDTNELYEYLPRRKFGLYTAQALEIVKPNIDAVLGEGTWEQTGGNFFETGTPYVIHADTGKEGPEKVWQTFVFPLKLVCEHKNNLEENRLIILNQRWKGEAAFFLKGSEEELMGYNTNVKDYEMVEGLVGPDYFDPYLLENCSHVKKENFAGLSVDKHFKWTPGVPITFPRDRLHLSNNFKKFGVLKKLGLSIFTSRK